MATDIERIQAHLEGDDTIEMTDHLREKLGRIKQMCALVVDHLDDTKCVALHAELTGVDEATAYRDLRDARKLQGDYLAIDRKFELLRLYNKQKRSIDKAEELEQMNAVMSGHRTAQEYLKLIFASDLIDLTKYKPHTVQLVFDPSLITDDMELPEPDQLQKIFEKLSKPKLDIDVDNYTEFEEIKDQLDRGKEGTS
jgi:hypothetical protein